MRNKITSALPKFEEIPESEYGKHLRCSLELCCAQEQQIQLQQDQLQLQQESIELLEQEVASLKDEISIQKKEKPRVQIKPSILTKYKDKEDKGKALARKKSKRVKGRKTKKNVPIHRIKKLYPENVPEGSLFKGYEDYIVQDINLELLNTKYRRARYLTPDGKTIYGQLPASIKGRHFGPRLYSYIISQYHERRVTVANIHRELQDLGVQISVGQINNILTKKKDNFHDEKKEIMRAGLEVSPYVNVDDTGARHKGQNGVCTHIGNDLFACFFSTQSKSRVNFLELLRAGHDDYVIDDIAREYMQQQKMPKSLLSLFGMDQVLDNKQSWELYVQDKNITNQRHLRIVTEAALMASAVSHGFSRELVIVSDDAGQFKIAGGLNALCWVHAERTINKLIAYNDSNRLAQARVRGQIWEFYKRLKHFRKSPSSEQAYELEKEFGLIFTQKTCFQSLNLALKRIYKNKEQLLLVLKKPEIPLHNNLSENDIREYVIKRKISSTTRSDAGRAARDTFLSLSKTCRKLRISFSQYLYDRISTDHTISPIAEIIRLKALPP